MIGTPITPWATFRPLPPIGEAAYATQRNGSTAAWLSQDVVVTSTANFCGNCGRPAVPGATFCDGCGAAIAPSPAETPAFPMGQVSPPPASTLGSTMPPPPPPGYGTMPPRPPGYTAPPPPPGYGASPPASATTPPAWAGYPGGVPAPAQQTTNGLAIASLVLGIIWIFGLGSILAVIFGFVGRKQIRQSGGRQSGDGLAIAGIVLGLIGVVGLVLWIVLIAVVATNIHNVVCDNNSGSLNGTTCTRFGGNTGSTGNTGSGFNDSLRTSAPSSGFGSSGPSLTSSNTRVGHHATLAVAVVKVAQTAVAQ
jgi:hypothetical protein